MLASFTAQPHELEQTVLSLVPGTFLVVSGLLLSLYGHGCVRSMGSACAVAKTELVFMNSNSCSHARALLRLCPHSLAPMAEGSEVRIVEASRAPFWSGLVVWGGLLWLVVSPALAGPEAPFFYHLALVVEGLGGVVGGIAAVFLPQHVLRAQLGLLAGVTLLILQASAAPGSASHSIGVIVSAVAIAVSSVAFAKPVRWLLVRSVSPLAAGSRDARVPCP